MGRPVCFIFLRAYFSFQGLERVGRVGLDFWILRGLGEPQIKACFLPYPVGLPAPLLAHTGGVGAGKWSLQGGASGW